MASAVPPALSFIVPVRNDADRLRRCLASIRVAAAAVASEIIVADNGSTDRSADVARAAGARVLDLPGRRVADLRNAGAHAASGDLLAFVDADHELDAGWGNAAIDLLGDRNISAAGASYHAPSDGTWVQLMYDRLRRHQPGRREVDWLPSGNLVVRREMFDRLKGFDASLETCEDVDLCQRLATAGGRLLADERLRSVHLGDPRTLKALFLGELWRGRDNLRVSLRVPLTLRSLPSLLIPIVDLASLAAIAIGLLTWTLGGRMLAGGGLVIFAVLAAARAVSLLGQAGPPGRGPRAMVQAVAVAGVYDLARALSLVTRTRHEFRRKA